MCGIENREAAHPRWAEPHFARAILRFDDQRGPIAVPARLFTGNDFQP